ncbi:hypothetical protein FQZ97_844810 [compost metagenome]
MLLKANRDKTAQAPGAALERWAPQAGRIPRPHGLATAAARWPGRAPRAFLSAPFPASHDPFAPRHPRHRLRHLQLGHGLGRRPGHGAPDTAGGRSGVHAHGGVLQRRRPPDALRARRGGAVPGRHRRAADALAQEPAGQPAADGEDRSQPPADQLPGDRGHLPRGAARTRRAGAGRRGAHAGGDGAAGALRGRRPRARRAGPALAAGGGAVGRVRAGVVPVGADRRRAGLRTPPGA